MALILRGRHKGKEVKVLSWGGNWVKIDHENIDSAQSLINPTFLQFTANERDQLRNSANQITFWSLYEWHPKNPLRLKKKKR